MYDYDVLAFIGRFQPFHNGHKSIVDEALLRAEKVAIVLGSDKAPRSARNPFTTKERVQMITAVYPKEVADGRIHFCPQVDYTYNIERWRAGIQASVSQVAHTPFTPDPVNIGLIGHSKDHSSFYLNSFPLWSENAIQAPDITGLNATDIRMGYFSGLGKVHGLPAPVIDFMREFQYSDAFAQVKAEHEFIQDYKQQWSAAPYAPTFFTADAIVVQSGHVLLVQRGAQPGEGLWAIPGGFVNQYETSREAAIRELVEETKIKVPAETLDRCINMWRVFEDPYRSQRGRTITTAFRVELRADDKLPKIKGSDDAAKAQWIPISNLQREVMFEDHFDILQTMVPF